MVTLAPLCKSILADGFDSNWEPLEIYFTAEHGPIDDFSVRFVLGQSRVLACFLISSLTIDGIKKGTSMDGWSTMIPVIHSFQRIMANFKKLDSTARCFEMLSAPGCIKHSNAKQCYHRFPISGSMF